MTTSRATVIFQHIPKTAGTTIISILEREYPVESRYKVNPMDLVNSLEAFKNQSEKGKEYTLIYGHLSEQLMPYIENEIVRFTFLRDPIDLFVSSFYYIKRATWNRNHGKVSKMKSIEEYMEFCDVNNLFNPQTRYLAGKVDYLYKNENPSEALSLNDFDTALENLDQIDYVFDLKKFDASILTIAKELNWRNQPYYTRKNATSNRMKVIDLNEKVREDLDKLLKFDLDLYQGCSESKTTAITVSEKALKSFRFKNNLRQKLKLG